jgi:UDP-glucose 4-epimerase
MKKVLITGWRGFIGGHLMTELDKLDFEIITIDNILCDIDDIPKADVIVHLAADPSVPYSIDHPYSTFKTNVLGTLNILEACRRDGAKIVFPSSSQASPEALNPYGLHKHHCEELIRLYSKLYHIQYCILRLYNVFGPGEHGVIGAFQKAAREGKPLELWGGYQKRDFVHIDTVVKYLIDGIENSQGIFEIGSGITLSVKEIADMISPNQIPMPMGEGQPMETRCPTPVKTLTVEEYLNAD